MQAGKSWQASWVRDNTGLEVQRTFSGGVTVSTERDRFGREVRKSVRSGGIERGAYRYEWGIAGRLLSKENELTGTVMRYDYDRFDFLIRQETTQGSETDVIYRVPDFVGNLFGTPDRKDRKYGAGGKLLEDPDCFYHYDDEGNLIFREFKQLQETGVRYDRKRMEKERGIRCLATGTGWLYEWASNGMLRRVVRPDGRPVEFRYDALGRRTAKRYFGKVTRWVWDGNVPLHEWCYKAIGLQSDEEENIPPKEPAEDVTTWVFEAGTFVPAAKIQDGKQYSIVSDYMGTPIQMYDGLGNKTWDCTLDIYGKVLAVDKGTEFDCPFRFQGQYADEETDLYYNRFRYYAPNIGNYICQDFISLQGGIHLYKYTNEPNSQTDILGLTGISANQALKQIDAGTISIRVKNKTEAEKLLYEMQLKEGYTNSGGLNSTAARDYYSNKSYYHWDTEWEWNKTLDKPVLKNHNIKGPDAFEPHLQFHPRNGNVIRVTWDNPDIPKNPMDVEKVNTNH